MNFVNDPAEIDAVLEMIEASGANVLLVGLGAPKQEIWIQRPPSAAAGRVMMGVGATIDYEAGAVKRAPVCCGAWAWNGPTASPPSRGAT
jgi:N-acetylglucosaminyldiphosphoundecaprenol N-acetyl-beta-D-mannosaminyltransferase